MSEKKNDSEEILLPRWFRTMKKIASELAFGFVGTYGIVHFMKNDINPTVFEAVNLVLITGGIPCMILSCSNIVEIIKKLKYNGND